MNKSWWAVCIGRILRGSDEYSGQCEPTVSHRHQERHVDDVRLVGAAKQEDPHTVNIQMSSKCMWGKGSKMYA
ncbi:hypothetical protein DPMN_153300 [Dreissena polymorpha]|uniref:Uncharacterized protein n=1 Tax=Dreissena polymorpha TaxID=45954 RepID=A0A9D4FIX9_DREPO|nr:hypothetical protein DPMN_153300 [Dreissena polymorpha]